MTAKIKLKVARVLLALLVGLLLAGAPIATSNVYAGGGGNSSSSGLGG